MDRRQRDQRRRIEAEERRRAEGWSEIALPAEADGIALAGGGGYGGEQTLQGTPDALYALAARVLSEIGLTHVLPPTYAEALAGVEVCPLCGEVDCDNC